MNSTDLIVAAAIIIATAAVIGLDLLISRALKR